PAATGAASWRGAAPLHARGRGCTADGIPVSGHPAELLAELLDHLLEVARRHLGLPPGLLDPFRGDGGIALADRIAGQQDGRDRMAGVDFYDLAQLRDARFE